MTWTRLDPRTVALWLAVVTVALGLLGGLRYLGAPLSAFNLDAEPFRSGAFEVTAEGIVPTLYSSLLSLAGAALAFALAARGSGTGQRPLALTAIGVLLAFMAVDEAALIHENIDDWLGLENWIVGYLPLIVAGGIAWIALLRRFDGAARVLWAAGAAAWALSTMLEVPVQQRVEMSRPVYGIQMESEELLSMVGSSCFLLALLIRIQLSRREQSRGDRVLTQAASARPHGSVRSPPGSSS